MKGSGEETQFQNEILKILLEMYEKISKVEQYFNVDHISESVVTLIWPKAQ